MDHRMLPTTAVPMDAPISREVVGGGGRPDLAAGERVLQDDQAYGSPEVQVMATSFRKLNRLLGQLILGQHRPAEQAG